VGGACSTHEKYKNAYKVWSENLHGRDRLEDTGVDGRIILKLIFEELDGE
jgi:hypothetical protein